MPGPTVNTKGTASTMTRPYVLPALLPELRDVAAQLPPPDYDDLAAAREMVAAMSRYLPAVDTTGVTIKDRVIQRSDKSDLPVRVYRPSEQAATARPALIFLHWGGFVLGDLDTEHGRCVRLCRDAGLVVVSVDYRLAPEHPYPAALDDADAALRWVFAEADVLGVEARRIGVGGTSAGAGLAAGLALRTRDRGGPRVAAVYLGYPVLDDRRTTPSSTAFPATPNWASPANERMWEYYLSGDRAADTYAAPARATELSGLPAHFIWTAEFDPLRDEGLAYAIALISAGVEVELHHVPGTVHGYDGLPIPSRTIAGAHADQAAFLTRKLVHGDDG